MPDTHTTLTPKQSAEHWSAMIYDIGDGRCQRMFSCLAEFDPLDTIGMIEAFSDEQELIWPDSYYDDFDPMWLSDAAAVVYEVWLKANVAWAERKHELAQARKSQLAIDSALAGQPTEAQS